MKLGPYFVQTLVLSFLLSNISKVHSLLNKTSPSTPTKINSNEKNFAFKMASASQENSPLNPKNNIASPKFGGHKVKWTVADIFSINPKAAVAYHSISTGVAVTTPLGMIVGSALKLMKLGKSHTFLATAATGGVYGGAAGITLGALGFCGKAMQGENATPPWTAAGVQDRADRLKVNFPVRVLDQGVWLGIVAGVLAQSIGIGPTLGFSYSASGYLQAMAVGSSIGSIGSGLCIMKLSKP